MSMANMACITKQGSQTPIIRAVVGDKNTKNFTFVVERFDGDEDLSGLVWMIEVENAQGVTDGTALFTYRTDKQIQLIWPVGGIATAVEGRTQLQVSGFDTGMNKQWGSGLYYIEVVRGMTPDDEQLKPVSQLQELIQQKKNQSLSYELLGEQGPDHCKEFFVRVLLNGKELGRGSGTSKKRAEQNAAAQALEHMQ